MSEPKASVGYPRRKSIEERLYEVLGQYDGVIYTRPPGDQIYMVNSEDSVIKTSNDGFELWIGTPSAWHWHCRFPEARFAASVSDTGTFEIPSLRRRPKTN